VYGPGCGFRILQKQVGKGGNDNKTTADTQEARQETGNHSDQGEFKQQQL
jgi:hypothetical protein